MPLEDNRFLATILFPFGSTTEYSLPDIIIDKINTRTVPKTNSTDGSGSLFPVFSIMESNFIFLRFS